MWRSEQERRESALRRLILARELWEWQPHPAQERLFCCPAQIKVAACGRRWGKTDGLAVDVVALALDEVRRGRECRQLIVAPTDTQARLLGGEALRRLLAAFDTGHSSVRGLRLDVRQRPALMMTLHRLAPTPGPSPVGTREGRRITPSQPPPQSKGRGRREPP